jgi:hypothetical protein
MHYCLTARSLVEIIDVLGDDRYPKDILELSQCSMRGIWLSITHADAAFIVKPKHR